MAYIGNIPADKYQTLQKQSFTTSATDTYTLSYAVTNPQDLALFINSVRQDPNNAYTVSNTTLTLSSAITSSDTMYAIFLGKSVETVAPAIGSVTNSMLANSSITLNGSAVSLGGSATIEGITVADQWRLSADNSMSSSGANDITANWERNDTSGFGQLGSGMTESSGIFTFPSTGIYSIRLVFSLITSVSADSGANASIVTTIDNSNYVVQTDNYVSAEAGSKYFSGSAEFIFDVTNTSTHKAKFQYYRSQSGTTLRGSSSNNRTYVTFIRLGDT